MSAATGRAVLRATDALSKRLGAVRVGLPVAHVYDPSSYARAMFAQYVERYGATRKRRLFVGMNPGPFGMAQTGIPFGEVAAVRDYLRLDAPIARPPAEHPKRPVLGLACPRSEVSGARLWGLFRAAFPDPRDFFREHFVLNYCPLLFLDARGTNVTPDKLRRDERESIEAACDAALASIVDAYDPELVIGVGQYAEGRLRGIVGEGRRVGRIAHPSPASPAANRGYAELVSRELLALGVEWSR